MTDDYAMLRSNVRASVEDYHNLRFLGERAAELPEIRAMGAEFTVEDRGAVFLVAMLNEFFTVTDDQKVYAEVLPKVNRFFDMDRASGGRAWTLVRDELLEIGRDRGWSSANTVWNDWTPVQQREFTEMIDTDLKALKAQRSGCYIATAVYGTYESRELWVLRRFRDETLATSSLGRVFISAYYAVSPIAVRHGGRPLLTLSRRPLDSFVRLLLARGISDEPYVEPKARS
jgi:hypothetical protein